MSLMRRSILLASQSRWLRERAPRYAFMRRTVTRFMPGENVDDALAAALTLAADGMGSVLTHLGENITDRGEAEEVTKHYLDVLARIGAAGLPTEVSVKLTQLGLDLDQEFCYTNLAALIAQTPADRTLWVDIEQSPYVDATLAIYWRARKAYANIGVCVQAYLYRTEKDENYFHLAQRLLSPEARKARVRAAIATHDRALIARLTEWAASQGIAKGQLEFQMLYGIQRAEQLRLAREGFRCAVLISYGSFWFPWFMRRMAERPANALFLARNFFSA